MFPEGGGFVNITVLEGGPTATGMNLEGGTAKKKLPSTPHRLINEPALTFVVDMSNKNGNNFCIISGPGRLLKLDIMVCKANVLTYIWSFCENLENYRRLIL